MIKELPELKNQSTYCHQWQDGGKRVYV
jgi:hypothetical protein